MIGITQEWCCSFTDSIFCSEEAYESFTYPNPIFTLSSECFEAFLGAQVCLQYWNNSCENKNANAKLLCCKYSIPFAPQTQNTPFMTIKKYAMSVISSRLMKNWYVSDGTVALDAAKLQHCFTKFLSFAFYLFFSLE